MVCIPTVPVEIMPRLNVKMRIKILPEKFIRSHALIYQWKLFNEKGVQKINPLNWTEILKHFEMHKCTAHITNCIYCLRFAIRKGKQWKIISILGYKWRSIEVNLCQLSNKSSGKSYSYCCIYILDCILVCG